MSAQAEIQKAIVATLGASSAVKALLGDPVRLYDKVPQAVAFPYAEFGDFQEIEDGAIELEASEVFVTLHVWSRVVGSVEAKNIIKAIRSAINGTEPSLTGHRCVWLGYDQSRVMDDPDGTTTHGVITLRALIDETP